MRVRPIFELCYQDNWRILMRNFIIINYVR